MTLLLSGQLLFSLCCEPPSDPLLGPGPDQELELIDLSGPYLGQTPPGATPVLFAPGFVSRYKSFEHSGAVFSRHEPPAHIRFESGPEFTARVVRRRPGDLEVKTLFIDPESPRGIRLHRELERNVGEGRSMDQASP